MIRFIEVIGEVDSAQLSLGEVWINEAYVVSVREARGYRSLLQEGKLPADLNEAHSFTTVVTNNGHSTQSHVVVGSPMSVAKRLKPTPSTLLKG